MVMEHLDPQHAAHHPPIVTATRHQAQIHAGSVGAAAVQSLDKYVDTIDLADAPSASQELNMQDHQIRYYRQYAAMGRAWANNHLGQVYLFSLRGIAQNYEMAAQHFEAAVNANDPVAANYLGRLYWNGLGRKKNLNKTVELFISCSWTATIPST
jgi:TPR repeat protein